MGNRREENYYQDDCGNYNTTFQEFEKADKKVIDGANYVKIWQDTKKNLWGFLVRGKRNSIDGYAESEEEAARLAKYNDDLLTDWEKNK